MTMISEVDNIIKGRVVNTMENDANKRIIGISDASVKSADGVSPAPLSKQGAFTVEQTENIAQISEKILGGQEAGVEVTDGMPDVAPVPVSVEPIAEPVHTETVDAVAVEMGNTESLAGLQNPLTSPVQSVPGMTDEEVAAQQTGLDKLSEAVSPILDSVMNITPPPEIPVDVELPANEEAVVATEPTEVVADALFASAPSTTVDSEPAAAEEVIPNPLPEPAPMPEAPLPAEPVVEEETKEELEQAVSEFNWEDQNLNVADAPLPGEDAAPEVTEEVAPAVVPADMPLPEPIPEPVQPEETPVAPLPEPAPEPMPEPAPTPEVPAVSEYEQYNKLVADEMSAAILGVMNKHIDKMVELKLAEVMHNVQQTEESSYTL